MKISWERTIYVGNRPIPCSICGRKAMPMRTKNNQYLLAVIYNHQDQACGEACRNCVASGAKGIKAHLQERIQALQTKLAELKELDAEDVQLPTLAQEFNAHHRDRF